MHGKGIKGTTLLEFTCSGVGCSVGELDMDFMTQDKHAITYNHE